VPTDAWSSDDGIGWRSERDLPVAGHNVLMVEFQDQLWTVAGHLDIGQSAELNRTSDGVTWTSPGTVPAAGEYHGTCVHAGRLWVAGGLGLKTRVVSTTDGVTWVDGTPLPLERDYATLLSFRGELWIVGGIPAQTMHSPDGVQWTTLPAFPVLQQGTTAVQFTPG